MEVVGKMYGIEDKSVPTLCLTGIPIVGKALCSTFFDPYDIPAVISVRELLSGAPARRDLMIRRVELMRRKAGPEMSRAIRKKTIKEVSEGTMRGPLTHSDIVARHGRFYNVVPSFGLEQGVDDKGDKKFRRIDDHSALMTTLPA